MKESLDPQSRTDLIKYRLERALSSVEEAKFLASGDYYNSAVNRLYYAAYYAASALMIAYKIEASTHKGIKQMLGLKFILPGFLDAKYGRIYSLLFENRQAGDYEDFIFCDKELFEILLPQSEDFINTLHSMIRNTMNKTS